MKFSLSSLLLVLVVCGIGFSLIRAWQTAWLRESFRIQLIREIDSANALVGGDMPDSELLEQRVEEQFASLASIRRVAEQSFEKLQKRYGVLEPRGDDILSLRTIPQLSKPGQPSRTVFRFHVPAKRDVWLKYAIVPADTQNHWSPALEKFKKPPTETGFDDNGFYEQKLAEGIHDLTVVTGPAQGHWLPINVLLDDDVLLATGFQGDGVPSSGAFHISGREQADFGSDRPLPWLHNSKISIRREGSPSEKAKFIGSLWLSDQKKGHPAFPAEEGPSEKKDIE